MPHSTLLSTWYSNRARRFWVMTLTCPSLTERPVVDQARLAEERGEEEPAGRVGLRRALQIDPATHLGVIDAQAVLLDHVARQLAEPQRVALAAAESLARRVERLPQRGRLHPLLAREVRVARREREAVALAHDRPADHLGAEVEIERHLLDDAQLLVVLLAEERRVRSRERQQLCHHRADAAKM